MFRLKSIKKNLLPIVFDGMIQKTPIYPYPYICISKFIYENYLQKVAKLSWQNHEIFIKLWLL